MNWLAVVLAAVSGDPAPSVPPDDDLLAILRAQPQVVGIALALLGFIPLLVGWSLVRWASALLTGALTVAVVVVCCHGRMDSALVWTAALSAGALMGFVGFFLVQAIVAVQVAAMAGTLVLTGMQHSLPTMPMLTLIAVVLTGALGAVVGWRTAPYLVIAQCVLNGFLVILAGMIVIVKPTGAELGWLALAVAVITILPGLLVQLRAHAREGRWDG